MKFGDWGGNDDTGTLYVADKHCFFCGVYGQRMVVKQVRRKSIMFSKKRFEDQKHYPPVS